MSQPKTLVPLSDAACNVLRGLIAPNEVIDSEEVCAPEEVWAELREAFPAEDYEPEGE